MGVIPQAYPLWLAEKRDREVRVGRILGWWVTESIETGLPGPSASNPIVAFTTAEGLLMDIDAPHSPLVFVADTREEAIKAAGHLIAAPTGLRVDADEPDEPRSPDARPRAQVRRRPAHDPMARSSTSDADPTDPTDPTDLRDPRDPLVRRASHLDR